MPYVGSLVGFFLFSFVADNYGRKLALTLAWMSATIGCLGLGVIYIYIFIASIKSLNGSYWLFFDRIWCQSEYYYSFFVYK